MSDAQTRSPPKFFDPLDVSHSQSSICMHPIAHRVRSIDGEPTAE
ncbi:hypothetical protein RBSWK_02619 [Rhodopirellula baltica SWK14]|uniref:Uncharacterized protein n=1 Tax=Rhodopirellula baltica SWK14 TaxID=993516 RepID=L7CGQ2_RHOBT|nr:hypothetical protein RBSWK_02619 [Rhodopirellula baltica SWK14]